MGVIQMITRMLARRFGLAGLAAFMLAAAAGLFATDVASAAAADPAPPPTASDEHWPDWIQGRPASLEAGGTAGWYFWHDDDGLHVRTTTPSDRDHVFTATLGTNGRFTDVDKVRLEDADDIRLSADHQHLELKFHTHDGIDGVDFRIAGGDRLRLEFNEGGEPIDPANIFVGRLSLHPESNPFVVRRRG
jgi:hypothetical protein